MKTLWNKFAAWITSIIYPEAAAAAKAAQEAAEAKVAAIAAEAEAALNAEYSRAYVAAQRDAAQPYVEFTSTELKAAYEKLAKVGGWDIPGTKATALKLVESKKAEAGQLRKKAADLTIQAQTTGYLADDVETGAQQLQAAIDLI